MAEYRKYMFDNFVVSNVKDKEPEAKTAEDAVVEIIEAEPQEEVIDEVVVEEPVAEVSQPVEPEVSVTEEVDLVEETPLVQEEVYSKAEFEAAVRQAEETGYDKGVKAASDDNAQKQNILLDAIKNQLMTIFAEVENNMADIEVSTLKFAVELVRKLLPTLEKERAEAEVKNFLQENFANFSAQESLSFSFNPDTVALVASSLGRLAEQNDFEGKIAVHKDTSLGPTDCRIEWKNGGVERKTAKLLDKMESLIDSNQQERENGQ